MPRNLPVILKSGQRFVVEVDNELSDEQVEQQLALHGASVDPWAKWKQKVSASLPAGTIRWTFDNLFPGTPEAALGDVMFMGVGTKAQLATKGSTFLVRTGARLAGPAAGAATTALAGEISGDTSHRRAALYMFGAGALTETGMAAGRVVVKNIAQRGVAQDAAARLGAAVRRWFPNTGTSAEMVDLFRGGMADKLASQRLGEMEAAMVTKVGAKTSMYLPSLTEVNTILPAKVGPQLGRGGGGIPIASFDEAYTALKQLRALRRSALSSTEPLKHMQVLQATDALEQDLVKAMGTAAPDAVVLFNAIQKEGRQMYAVIDAVKNSNVISPEAAKVGGQVDLNPLLEDLIKPGPRPLYGELLDAGAGYFIHGILPEGAKVGAADIIRGGKGLYIRTRGNVGASGGLPVPEIRQFVVPPGRRIPGTVLSTPAAAAAGEAGRQEGQEGLIPTEGPVQ